MSEEKIKYLKHPVSPEQKRKLIAEGYKILDARFEPAPKKEAKASPKKGK